MKKYMKPVMESEVFVTNEFVSACATTNTMSCLNLNSPVNAVYLDVDKDGVLDTSEMTSNLYPGERYDCSRSGDVTAKNHTTAQIDTSNLYFVGYVTQNVDGTTVSNFTPAYKTLNGDDDSSYHFVSVTSYRNAS